MAEQFKKHKNILKAVIFLQKSFLMKIIAKSAFLKTICQFFATTYFFVVPITGPSMYLSFYDDVQVPGVYQAPGPGPQPDLQLGH